MEQREQMVPQAQQVQQGLRVPMVQPVLLAQPDLQEQMELLVSQVQQDLRVPMVLLVLQDLPA